MNKSLLVSILVLTTSLLTACGGGGNDTVSEVVDAIDTIDTVDTDTPETTGDAVAGVQPIIPFSSSGTNIFAADGVTSSIALAAGFEGDIETRVVEQTFGDISQFSLVTNTAQGISSINVVDVERTQAIDFTCENGDRIIGSIVTDFLTGEETASGTINGEQVSCSSQYQVVLPMTVSSEESIETLLIGYSQFDSGLVSSNCPTDSVTLPNPENNICNGTLLRNITVTDENGGEHISVDRVITDINLN